MRSQLWGCFPALLHSYQCCDLGLPVYFSSVGLLEQQMFSCCSSQFPLFCLSLSLGQCWGWILLPTALLMGAELF